MAETDFPIALDADAQARIAKIAEEQNVDAYEVIRTFAEEGALNYFRNRPSCDPARN